MQLIRSPGKTRTLLLVDPYPRNNPYHLTASERRSVWFPKLSLPVIAAYTPSDWEVDLVDEAVQDVEFDRPCDLVGLSVMPCYAPRAYELVKELTRIKQWIRGELVERMREGSLWQAFMTGLRIRIGLEDGTIFAFVDDLHNSNRGYCRELWEALKPLKIKWGCQSTLFLGDDAEMVKLAAESGCVSVFVGMESLDEDCLQETNKSFNRVQKFEDEIKMFHEHGIMVNPGIVFGFDNDDEAVFERAVEFLVKNRVELAYFNVLTPLPGTPLYERYNNSGRIFDRDWAKYA